MKNLVLMTQHISDAERLYAAFKDDCRIVSVVVEEGPTKVSIFSRRAKRTGIVDAFGQALMAGVIAPALRMLSRRRIRELESLAPRERIPVELLHRVRSVNGGDVREALSSASPDAVLVYGTRLLSKLFLEDIRALIINIHAGITPEYRGGHGAYWAFAEGRPELAGVTLHKIDEGIDTGEILAQATIVPSSEDSFVTYPILQRELGIELARKYLLSGETRAPLGSTKGPLYAHPTAWKYLSLRGKGIR